MFSKLIKDKTYKNQNNKTMFEIITEEKVSIKDLSKLSCNELIGIL